MPLSQAAGESSSEAREAPAGDPPGELLKSKSARQMQIDIEGMACTLCENWVRSALQAMPGVQRVVEVSHAEGVAKVGFATNHQIREIDGAHQASPYVTLATSGTHRQTHHLNSLD